MGSEPEEPCVEAKRVHKFCCKPSVHSFFLMTSTVQPIFRLRGYLQSYAWGKIGMESQVAKIAHASGHVEVDPNEKYAGMCIDIQHLDLTGQSTGWEPIMWHLSGRKLDPENPSCW